MIELKNVSYTYENSGSQGKKAVKNVSLKIADGEFWSVIGHTGSGKSTLTEIMSGLLTPDEGELWVDGENITALKSPVSALRGKVGMVFQYPEHQLFEESVIKDISFGPKNMGLSKKECEKRAKEAMRLVNLPEEYENLSPFELSGGEKRRVAIAGVLAMQPDTLILDEPTAGLDPEGRINLLNTLKNIKGRLCKSIVLVSHSMEDVALYAEKVIVMDDGKIIMTGDVGEVFKKSDVLIKCGLDVPQITRLIHRLNEKGYGFDNDILTVEDACNAIYDRLKG